MLRIEELEALDLLVWLQSGLTAAAVAGTSQSTIYRRAQRALVCFQADLRRDSKAWSVETPLVSLLDLQRHIHQQWRFKTGRSLRLAAPAWSREALRRLPLPGWIITPEQGPCVCDNPLQLLRAQVIDACLVTPTQLAGESLADLALIDLYSSRIDSWLVAGAVPEDAAMHSSQAAQALLLQGRLRLPAFLPSCCRDWSRQRWAGVRQALDPQSAEASLPLWQRADAAPQLVFLTPVMARLLGDLRPQPLPLPLVWPYHETLVVLRSAVDQVVVQALVEILQRQLPRTLESLVPGGAAAIG